MEQFNIPQNTPAPTLGEKVRYTFERFQTAMKEMVAINDRTYTTNPFVEVREVLRPFSPEEIKQILENGQSSLKQELSRTHYLINGIYRRILTTYATMLEYQGLLIPHMDSTLRPLGQKRNQQTYDKALSFLENSNLPDLCTRFALKTLVNGTYYGIVKIYNNQYFNVIDLPYNYCRTRFKSPSGNELIEFNLQYFDAIVDDELREKTFNAFPKYFKKNYLQYADGKILPWIFIPEEDGVCFKFFEDFPFFLNIIPSTINFEEYQELEKKRDTNEIKKILVQSIPIDNQGEVTFEPEEAEEMHKAAVSMMKKNDNISVLTTYADVTLESVADTRQAINNNLEKVENAIYSETGTSKQLYNATGNLTIGYSIQNDIAFMMILGCKFARFFQNIVNRVFASDRIDFSYTMLPISQYNKKEYIENTYKLAGSGYSIFLPALATGLSQRNFIDLKKLENNILDMPNLLIPVQSSFNGGTKDNGRPAKSSDQLADKSMQNNGAQNQPSSNE